MVTASCWYLLGKKHKNIVEFENFDMDLDNVATIPANGSEDIRLLNQNVLETQAGREPNLGEDKGGLLGPKMDKYKECSLLVW